MMTSGGAWPSTDLLEQEGIAQKCKGHGLARVGIEAQICVRMDPRCAQVPVKGRLESKIV